MLVQRALVLLGSVSNAITLERRKIAWSRFNPKLKSLGTEEYEKRKKTSLGRGFWKKPPRRSRQVKHWTRWHTPQAVLPQGRGHILTMTRMT